MELAMSLVIGLLFASGVYLLLRPNLVRMVIGFGLLSNAVNLLMIVVGGFSLARGAPFVSDAGETAMLMDPLPPDVVLTAIVINFAVGALFLTICYVVYRDHGSDDPDLLPRAGEEGDAA